MSEDMINIEDDVTDYLKARLDEDEEIARAANPSPWRLPDEANQWRERNGRALLNERTIFGDGMPRGVGKMVNVCNLDYSWEWKANAAHIIRNQPARVLRQVSAMRAIMAVLWREPHQLCDECTEWDGCERRQRESEVLRAAACAAFLAVYADGMIPPSRHAR